MSATFKVWVSRYALTEGIYEVEVRGTQFPDSVQETTKRPREIWERWHSKNQWHKTREEAVAKATQIRERRIASLHKQIKKWEALEFR